MPNAIDYAQRVAECRRLAAQCAKPEDWGHFLELAETWEILLRHQHEKARLQTIALADRFRDALFLPEEFAAAHSRENAA